MAQDRGEQGRRKTWYAMHRDRAIGEAPVKEIATIPAGQVIARRCKIGHPIGDVNLMAIGQLPAEDVGTLGDMPGGMRNP